MRVTVIHNPGAGEGEPSADVLLKALRQNGYDPAYQSSDDENWERALENPGELIVVAGGDGTVARVAKQLADHPSADVRRVPVAVLPLGTANNIACSIGARPAGLSEQIAAWHDASPASFDVGRAVPQDETDAGAPFVESVGCGLFADMMVRFQARKQSRPEPSGPDEELHQARQELRRMLREGRARDWRVELDGQDYSGGYLLIEVMNIRQIGPGFELAPGAAVGDGLLDVVFVCDDAEDRARLDAHLREHPADEPAPPLLTTRRARQVVIDARGDRVHLDDKLWEPGRAGAVRLGVDAHRLTFLAP